MEEMKPESIVAVEGDANQCGISKLPQDLKELIFSKLPLESICSSRIICKEWNSILSSDNFLSSLPIQYPWLLICHEEKDKNWRWETKYSHIYCDEMVVCNDFIFWRERGEHRVIIGFKIQDEGFISPVTVAPSPSEMVEDEDLFLLSMVSYGSSVLFVFVKLNHPRLDIILPPSYAGIHPSTVHKICELGRTQDGIVIWELFQDEQNELVWKWKEFLRMPPLSLHEYLDKHWWYGECVCVGDYLCFSSLYGGGESVKVFAYNLKEGFWQRLPPCKMENRNWRMASFEPKPYLYQFLRKSRERAWMT
ncbi:hypothetical protein SUGI_0956720 [Cryptomeria japonica]|nr:hypothetical protein SUGI_0956720 [Cryptomeria japonica]